MTWRHRTLRWYLRLLCVIRFNNILQALAWFEPICRSVLWRYSSSKSMAYKSKSLWKINETMRWYRSYWTERTGSLLFRLWNSTTDRRSWIILLSLSCRLSGRICRRTADCRRATQPKPSVHIWRWEDTVPLRTLQPNRRCGNRWVD